MSNKINNLTPNEWFEKFMQTLEKSSADFEKRLEKSSADFEKWKKEEKERAAKREQERQKSNADFEKWKLEREQERQKSNAEFEKWKLEMQKHISGIAESNGNMAEEMIYNSLEKDMTFSGIKFDAIKQNVPVMSGFDTKTELDVLMVNGDTLAIIETKYKVENKDVTKLIKKQLTDFRQCFPKYDNYKILLGIGGMSFEDKAIDEAKENGIGIIKVVGDKVEYYTEGMKIY